MEKQNKKTEHPSTGQENSTQAKKKNTASPSDKLADILASGKMSYPLALHSLEVKAKEFYGDGFRFYEDDKMLIYRLISYFLKDEPVASQLNINLNKGILLTGPIGCGKTTLMNLMRFLESSQNRFIIKSCRDVSFEFIKDGYEIIHKYSRRGFQNFEPKTYCFDDLGTENNLKYYGNECNIMAEVLLSRYDLFVSQKIITHLTTNLSATELTH